MIKETEDIHLIKNILAGDKEAESELYIKYKKIVTDFLNKKYYKNYIEDDVSEIMIKIFLSLPKFNPELSKFKTWVFSISKNHMIDKSRCCDVLSGTLEIDNDSISISDGLISDTTYYTSSYSTDIHKFESTDTINFISTQLASCDFTFLNMKYGEGYDYNEIGSEFNVTSNTVSNRVNYIKSKIKNSLESLE